MEAGSEGVCGRSGWERDPDGGGEEQLQEERLTCRSTQPTVLEREAELKANLAKSLVLILTFHPKAETGYCQTLPIL